MPASYIRIHPVRQRFADKCRTFPEQFALVGPTVPDYRMLFLRGVGGSSAASGIVQNNMVGAHGHIVSSRASEQGGSGTPSPHGRASSYCMGMGMRYHLSKGIIYEIYK